jgi:hypothetical protein
MGTVRSIGILGGTGALGRGLAKRLSVAGFSVALGSRDPDRARVAAESVGHRAVGVSNEAAAEHDLVIVAVPWDGHGALLRTLEPQLRDTLVIDCVNPLGFDQRGPFALDVPEGSAAQQAQLLLPESAVVGAFHHIAADALLSDDPLGAEVLVVGDELPAVETVISLVDSIDGLRGVYAGRLRNAHQVEALTANLIAINRRYRAQAGIRITGLS